MPGFGPNRVSNDTSDSDLEAVKVAVPSVPHPEHSAQQTASRSVEITEIAELKDRLHSCQEVVLVELAELINTLRVELAAVKTANTSLMRMVGKLKKVYQLQKDKSAAQVEKLQS